MKYNIRLRPEISGSLPRAIKYDDSNVPARTSVALSVVGDLEDRDLDLLRCCAMMDL
jgi:hypothetical protein